MTHPLTYNELLKEVRKWCWADSNHRLTDFQSDALPPELQHQIKSSKTIEI